jgi:hypothetical protein
LQAILSVEDYYNEALSAGEMVSQFANGDAEAAGACHTWLHDCLGGHLLAGDGE